MKRPARTYCRLSAMRSCLSCRSRFLQLARTPRDCFSCRLRFYRLGIQVAAGDFVPLACCKSAASEFLLVVYSNI